MFSTNSSIRTDLFLLLKLRHQAGKAAFFFISLECGANLWEAKHTRPPWITDWTLGDNPN